MYAAVVLIKLDVSKCENHTRVFKDILVVCNTSRVKGLGDGFSSHNFLI